MTGTQGACELRRLTTLNTERYCTAFGGTIACCQRNYIARQQISCEAGPGGASCVTGGNGIASYCPSAVCTTSGTCQP